ncbi:hypothetical protein ACWOBH_06170 [Globicatella sanguinis]
MTQAIMTKEQEKYFKDAHSNKQKRLRIVSNSEGKKKTKQEIDQEYIASVEEIKPTLTTEDLMLLLALNPQYTVKNIMFLAKQGARGRIQAFSKWKAEGLKIAKGSKAYRVFAPCTRKTKDGEQEIYGYKLVPVFSAEQIEGWSDDDINRICEAESERVMQELKIDSVEEFEARFGDIKKALGFAEPNAVAVDNLPF